MAKLIEVNKLNTLFRTKNGVFRAVSGVDFSIEREKTLGIVGESGCGKSVTALSIMRLIRPPGQIESGEILFNRNESFVDLAQLDPMGPHMRSIRGNEIAMIFQEPMTALNPVYTIGSQIMEPIQLHQNLDKQAAKDKAVEMLQAVGIPAPEKRVNEYPHELSGGMRQRAMIAMSLSCNPSLLIADEPTTALDVTIQAQVLRLMQDLQRDFKAAIMFITHDLGVIAQLAHEVAVMYLGGIVEKASVIDIFDTPKHPYTRGLMHSIPSLTTTKETRLQPISGVVPDIQDVAGGCRFASRCPEKMDECSHSSPPLKEVAPNHYAACWKYL